MSTIQRRPFSAPSAVTGIGWRKPILIIGFGCLISQAASAALLDVTAGVLIGFGLSGTSFMVVLAAFGKLLPPEWRSRAFGFGTAAGSFGQFLFSPVAVALMDGFGWQQTLLIFGASTLAILPLSLALTTPKTDAKGAAPQSLRSAL